MLLSILKGMIVGTGAILPGVSGGVLCMAFGIYEPLMEILADPLHNAKKHLKLFLPFIVGWLAGFFLLAKVLEILFLKYETTATVFFAAAILGTIPGLMKEAGLAKKNSLILLASILLFTLVFMSLGQSERITVEANTYWYVFSGAVWGLSLIVPGLSSSSVLILMGLYQKITAAIAALDFAVILPMAAGLLFTALSLSRIVNSLFTKKRGAMLCFISGIMIASALCMLLKASYTITLIPVCILVFAAGFALSLKFDG